MLTLVLSSAGIQYTILYCIFSTQLVICNLVLSIDCQSQNVTAALQITYSCRVRTHRVEWISFVLSAMTAAACMMGQGGAGFSIETRTLSCDSVVVNGFLNTVLERFTKVVLTFVQGMNWSESDPPYFGLDVRVSFGAVAAKSMFSIDPSKAALFSERPASLGCDPQNHHVNGALAATFLDYVRKCSQAMVKSLCYTNATPINTCGVLVVDLTLGDLFNSHRTVMKLTLEEDEPTDKASEGVLTTTPRSDSHESMPERASRRDDS